MRSIYSGLAGVLLSGLAAAQTTSEGFDNGSNLGGWTWGSTITAPTGGNPGFYRRGFYSDPAVPTASTGPGVVSLFTGNYRVRRIIGLGIDLLTESTSAVGTRPLSLILENDNGTQFDTSDDRAVYTVTSGFVPTVGAGWTSHDVVIPSQSTVLPPGWSRLQGSGSDDDVWNGVIGHVTRVRWYHGDRGSSPAAATWVVGMDNVRISTDLGTPYCFGDGSGTPCPCGNNSVAPRGCANSASPGAHVNPRNSPSLSANELVLHASGLPPTASALLFQGTSRVNAGSGTVFGDGLLCVGGSIVRLGVRQAVASQADWGPGLAHGVPGPTTVHFQVWYRNVSGPCGSGWNLSNGHTIALTP